MTEHLEPAPEGFEVDEARLEAAAISAFVKADPDMHREIVAGRIYWRLDLDADRHVLLRTLDKATDAELGTLELRWQDVCRIDGET